jgi:hypothetical protein
MIRYALGRQLTNNVSNQLHISAYHLKLHREQFPISITQ